MGRYQRVITNIPVQCPAGDGIGETPEGTACRCRITRDVITSVEDGPTLGRHCFGDYTTCPTWRADKEAYWATRSNRGLLDGDNLRVPDDFDRERAAILEERDREQAAISLG